MAKNTNPGSLPMSQDELKVLQDAVADVGLQDAKLGRVLDGMLSHLARLNNLDYPVVVEAPAPQFEASAEQAQDAQAPSQEGA